MSSAGQIIKRLREQYGWAQAELGERVGLASTSIARRESGQIRVKGSEWPRFTDAFGTSTEEFRQHIRSVEGGPAGDPTLIPVLNRGPAGIVIDYERTDIRRNRAFEYLDFGEVAEADAFAIYVIGDSMEPSLREGEQVIFAPIELSEPGEQPANGQIVFVSFDPSLDTGTCTLARFYADEDDTVRLQKDNPAYAPIICSREMVELVALAVERRVRM